MGWYSHKISYASPLGDFMRHFEEKLAEAGAGDEEMTIEIKINGTTQETLNFKAESGEQVRKMLRASE